MLRGSQAVHFPRDVKSGAERSLCLRFHAHGKGRGGARTGTSLWSAGFAPQLTDFPLLVRARVGVHNTLSPKNTTGTTFSAYCSKNKNRTRFL